MIENRQELINEAGERAFKYEADFGGCAQCTMAGTFDALGIKSPLVVKAGTSLAGGIGKMCDGPCGGYSGGAMAISSIFGRRQSNLDGDIEDKEAGVRMVQELRKAFMDEYGSVICGDLHMKIFGRRYDMNDEKDKEQFDADGAHTEKCTSVVKLAASTATSLILEEADRRGMSLEDLRKKASD